MILSSPEWLLLIPALAFVGWRWPGLRLFRLRRILILLGIVALLVDPRIPSRRGGMDLWVLLDRSASTGDLVDRGFPEWKALLEKARPSRHDTIHYLDYAAEVLPADPGGASSLYGSRRGQTRTALAIGHVLAAQDASRPARILVFSDGYSTEPLREAAAKMTASGMALDYRLIQEPAVGDYRVVVFDAPDRVQSGESFILRTAVSGPEDGPLPLRLLRDGQPVGEAKVVLRDGRGSVELIDRLGSAGAHLYEVEILPGKDAHPGNNRASRWVEVSGGPRVLLITRHPDDPLAAIFRAQGLEPDIITEPRRAGEGSLAGARAVVINNVPAFDLNPEFMRACDFFVKEQGGGLMMIGGKHSFGSGGYFQSSIDPLLPVSMELKADHRKLTVAMAIVLDRSGSMMAQVPGPGGKAVTKMDMADTGAAGAVELLGPGDFLSVHAVDSEAHPFVPMNQVGDRQAEIIGKIRSIRSEGGGIFIYNGLNAAWKGLRKTPAGTRHIILFADAADSEEPGAYKDLLAEAVKEGATVSVIGMGTANDCDAALLEDIAKRGNGRIQFTDRAAEIPRLFAQETMTIARKSFIEEATGAQPTGQWPEISPQPLVWLKEVDGYNLSYARPEATVSLATKDEYLAPLVATMRRGLGRSAAVAFPLAGEFSQRAREWPGYGDFVKTLARWLAGPGTPAGLGLARRLEGNRLVIDLYYATGEWGRRLSANPPRLKLSSGAAETPAPVDIPWQRMAPGHYSANIDLEDNDIVKGVVQVGDYTLPFGPVNVPVSAEWSFDPERLSELRAASAQTGGRDLLDLADAWLRPPVRQLLDLRLPLALLVLVVFLFDALATRMGFEPRVAHAAAVLRSPWWRAMLPQWRRGKKAAAMAPMEPASQPAEAPTEPVPDEDARRRRYERAKSGSRNRS